MRKLLSLMIILPAIAGLIVTVDFDTSASGVTLTGVENNAEYNTHCVKCHGKDGKGIESLQPPDFTSAEWQAKNTNKQIADVIRNGAGIMPGYKDTLSAAKINGLVKHIRSFGPKTAKKK